MLLPSPVQVTNSVFDGRWNISWDYECQIKCQVHYFDLLTGFIAHRLSHFVVRIWATALTCWIQLLNLQFEHFL